MGHTQTHMSDTVDTRRVTEFSEKSEAELHAKLDQLADMVRSAAGSTVFFTGAGVSTAAGIADYRGPTGVWTRQRVKKLQSKASRTPAEKGELELLLSEAKKKGKDGAARGGFGLQSAEPTSGHMVMSTLVRNGLARHVVTTNLDGLHRKSGLEHHKSLTCLHGDIYIERCTACAHEVERDYHVRNNAPRKLNVHDHSIGTCTKCGSKPPRSYTGKKGANDSRKGLVCPRDKNCGTKDTHINFGESLDDIDWDEAERVCEAAKLCIVVGTSMSLDHVTHMPFMSGRTVIINLQKTPYDKQAHLRIFAHADVVLTQLMERLALPIDPVPEAARRGKKEVKKLPQVAAGAKKAPTPPSSATSMRKHIRAVQGGGGGGGARAAVTETVELSVEAAPVGVSVRGREIIKIVPGSQAEKLGVQLGWKISHVGGKEMPPAGQPAADGITKALAAGKKGGRRYSIKFSAPAAAAGKSKSPRGVAAAKSGAMAGGGAAAAAGSTKLPSAMGSLGKPVSSKKSSKLSTSTAFGAFGAFSSGLGAVGMSEEKLMQAHQSMAKLNEEMALVDMMCA